MSAVNSKLLREFGVLFYCTWLMLFVEARQTYTVPCDHTTDACECPSSFNGAKVDVCAFSLTVQRLQTFTRYTVDSGEARAGVRRHGGKMWYVNQTTGEWHPFPDGQDTCSGPLSDTSCTHPIVGDGKAYRSIITINGRFPGPTLIAGYNQTLLINVTNLLLEAVTIHWHGQLQTGTNWMDGVNMVTQCGILPGTTFTYIFQADPPGTYWYHSHAGSQRADGLYGGLVVRETEDAVKVAQEAYGSFTDLPHRHTLTFLDYQAIDSFQLYFLLHQNTIEYNTDRSPNPAYYNRTSFAHAPDGSEVGVAPYWSGVINGRGRHTSVPYNKTRLSIFTVSPSSAYRFRLIGVQNFHPYRVSVDEHTMVVVATDGALLEPKEVDYLIIWSGERYDIIIHTKDPLTLSSDKSNFMIRGETLETEDPIKPGEPRLPLKDHVVEAILHYDVGPIPTSTQYEDIVNESVPVATRCKADSHCTVLNCPFKSYPLVYNLTCHFMHELSLLVPLPDEQLPDVHPDERLFLNFGFEGTHQTSSINARNYVFPSSPLSVLNSSELSIMKEHEYCKGLDDTAKCANAIDSIRANDCQCTHVQSLDFNSSVQMVLSGVSPNPTFLETYKSTHPVHMHGHQFQVLEIGHGNYTPAGLLYWPNQDISCNGARKVCNNPSWVEGKEYDKGRAGKVRANAPLKDSITVPSGGYVVVYFRSSNPGFWFLHCHVDMHQLAGMQLIIGEAVDRITKPPHGLKQCGAFATTVDSSNGGDGGSSDSVTCDGVTGDGVIWYISVVTILCLLIAVCIVAMALVCCYRFCARRKRTAHTVTVER